MKSFAKFSNNSRRLRCRIRSGTRGAPSLSFGCAVSKQSQRRSQDVACLIPHSVRTCEYLDLGVLSFEKGILRCFEIWCLAQTACPPAHQQGVVSRSVGICGVVTLSLSRFLHDLSQSLLCTHSFSNDSLDVQYHGEWATRTKCIYRIRNVEHVDRR